MASKGTLIVGVSCGCLSLHSRDLPDWPDGNWYLSPEQTEAVLDAVAENAPSLLYEALERRLLKRMEEIVNRDKGS